jgi:hypothetical protein
MSEADIPIDRAHYDCIVETARDVRHLTKAVDDLAAEVRGIAARIAACPCPAVKELQADMETLQTDAANLRGKFAVIVSALGVVAGWIGSLIPGLIGRV